MSIIYNKSSMFLASEQEEFDDIIFPPGNLWSEEPALESYLHLQQMILLLKCLDWWWRDRNNYFSAGNITVYFSPNQKKSEHFRGPDFLVVLDTERKPRRSWVVWEEGKYPNIIIELLSPSTAEIDKGFKKQLYQDTFRTFDYFWFDPETLELAGFHLVDGKYQPLEPNPQGWLWSQQLELFLGVHNSQLRFFSSEGQLLPTPEESATEAETSLAKAETLLAKYREQFGELPES